MASNVGTVYFYMTQPREVRRRRDDGLPGALLGRFLPDVDNGDGTRQPLSYRLTPMNQEFVTKWVEEGAAVLGVRQGSAVSMGLKGTIRAKIVTEDK